MADEEKPDPKVNGAGDPKALTKEGTESPSSPPSVGATSSPDEAPTSGSTSPRSSPEPRGSTSSSSMPASGKKMPSSPWPSAHRSEVPKEPPKEVSPPKREPEPEPPRAAWGAPIAKLDRAWVTLESRLAAGVLIAEILTLLFWISIRALSATGRAGPGMIYRALVTALVFGVVAHKVSKKHERHELLTSVVALAGFVLGTQWGEAGTTYFSNLFAWLQNSSILVFFGGVSELAKRFTLWLALLGASLATAQGKHINVDVVMRFLSPRARVPVAVLGWVAAAIVSISASWGFFDYVCVEELRAPPTVACPDDETKRCPAPPSTKVDKVLSSTSRNFFLARKQLGLDLRSFPKVITGTPYNKWMTPKDWNEWLSDGGWDSHFKTEDWRAFLLPEDGTIDYRNPAVTAIPGGTEAIQKLLVPLLNLVFAFGLLVIGVRFIVRSLLAISGWVKVDPAAAHGDDELAHAHDHSPEAELAEAKIRETHS